MRQSEEHLSDGALANHLGVSRATVSLLKSGGRAPGRRFIEAVLRQYPALATALVPDEEAGGTAVGQRRG